MFLVGNSIASSLQQHQQMWRLLALGSNWEKSVKKANGISSWLLLSCGKMGFDEWFDSLVVELKGLCFPSVVP